MEAIKEKIGDFAFFGYEDCPQWLKKKYREAVNFTCQNCRKKESEVGKLQPHRLKRGYTGGLYTVLNINHIFSNIKVVCNKCHKKMHSKEFLS
jgi:5-methylcytosine-specific restriction endonuclease McrA